MMEEKMMFKLIYEEHIGENVFSSIQIFVRELLKKETI